MGNQRGTSLFEILIALAIVFIMAIIAYPNLKDYSQHQDLNNSSKEVIGSLKLAQQYTVTEQVKYSVKVDLLQNTYALYKKGNPDELIDSYTIADQVYFSQVTGLQNDEAVFNPTGAVDYNGEIYLTHQASGLATKIIIKPSGYVTWEKN